MVKPYAEQPPAVDRRPRAGRRLHDSGGRQIAIARSVRRALSSRFISAMCGDGPHIPANDLPWLKHYAVSRWDAPRDSAIRERCLLDPGNVVTRRYGCAAETMVSGAPRRPCRGHRADEAGCAPRPPIGAPSPRSSRGGAGMTIGVSYHLQEATVLITGAGSGIGAALARHCAREGAASSPSTAVTTRC